MKRGFGRASWTLLTVAMACLAVSFVASANDAGTPAALDAGAADAGADDDTTSTVPAPSALTKINIGVYLAQIHNLDLKAGTATVTYYVWTRWRGEADGTAYELVNGTVDSREHEYRVRHYGVFYAYYRCRATVQVDVDYHAFPFDQHTLVLAFEHSDMDRDMVQLVIDRGGMKHAPSPAMTGWIVDRPRYDILEQVYRTNWGAPNIPVDQLSIYSRFQVRVRIHHAPLATFAKTFLALFISVLITALAFFIDPADMSSRSGLGVAGVFGGVASQLLVAENLPDIPYMTLSDKVHITGLLFVFFVLSESCLVAHLARSERPERIELARRIDRIAGVAACAGFVGIVAAFIINA